MRPLFSSTSGMGHFNPLVPLIDATFGALAAGLPLVIVPMFADQPANARLVESAGARLAVEPTGERQGRTGVPAPGDALRIRQSLESILADDS
jgi:UDP-glucoronosyl and UDP-glucosyl transferase